MKEFPPKFKLWKDSSSQLRASQCGPQLVPYDPTWEAEMFISVSEHTAAIEALRAEISALKQEVAGGSWALVKQIEDLKAEYDRLYAEALRLADIVSDYQNPGKEWGYQADRTATESKAANREGT